MTRYHFDNCKNLKHIETPDMRTSWEQFTISIISKQFQKFAPGCIFYGCTYR
jgi:hypothetical protein